MTVSIAIAYHNRLELLKETLVSIAVKTRPLEVVIVDDASALEPLSQAIIDEISCGLNIIFHRFEPTEKTWVNPCIAYNKAFSLCSGDVVLIQNAECYHRDDLVAFCETIHPDIYYVFGCYSLPVGVRPTDDHPLQPRTIKFDGDDGWYHHSLCRASFLHFASAISRQKLLEFRGFDENYANAVGYDDNEFLWRVNNKMTVLSMDNLIVFHQNHYNEHTKNIFNSPTNCAKFQRLVTGNYNEFKSSL